MPRGQGWLLVAQDECSLQDRCHVLGEANGAMGFGLAQLAQVLEQVSEALLLKPGPQILMVISRKADAPAGLVGMNHRAVADQFD